MSDKGFMNAVIRDNKYVFSLLEELSEVLWRPNAPDVTVSEFFDMWKQQNEIPGWYNINTFTNLVRFIYAGISVPKDIWFEEISEDFLSDLNGEWGIEEADCCFSDGRRPRLRDCITRIRNAVAHANVEVIVPEEYFSHSFLYDKTIVKFTDDYLSDNTFQATMSARKVITLVNKLSELSEKAYLKEWKKKIKEGGVQRDIK